ncbi:MAG: hypothetical protein UT55_C0001G0022 [Candidatus Peregrinibacteria bacterium GW2011_GWE2_39_6]|nr:MAG: hypothetical protein UT55_C0001G0022 [Candidatus Peregrinibacteria bacterium GW2011_GWE2_39_6]
MATSLDKITAIATQRFEEMLGNMTIEPLLHQTAIDIGLRIQEALTQDNGQGTANALPPEQMALLNRTHARILEAVARAPGLSPEATQGLNALDAALCDALIRDEESHLKQEGITPENVSWWNILKTHGWREVWSAAATKGNSLYEGLRDNRVNPRLKDIASRIVNLSDIDLLPPNDGRIVLRALAKTAPNLILFDIEDRNGVEGLRSWLNDPNPTTTEVRNRLTTLLGAEALTKLTSDMQALLAYLQSQTDPVACLDPLFTAVQQTTQQTNPDTLLATIEPLYEGISNRFKVRIERAREAVELLTQISTVENDRIKLFKNRQQQEQEQTKLNTELGTISVNQKAQRAQCQRQIEAITQQITTTDQHLEEKTREAKKLRKRYLTLRTKTQGQSAPDAALFIDLPKEPPRFTQRTNTNRIINLLDTAILDLETQANEWETKRNGRLDDDSDPGQAARNHGLHFKTFRELESTYTTLEQASNEQRLRERKIPGAPLAAPTTHPLPTRTPLLCLRELIRNDQTINRGVPADNQDLHVDLITLLMVDLTKNSEVTYPEQTKRLARARLKKLGLITEKQEKSIDYVSFPKFMQQLSQQDENFRALATLPPDASSGHIGQPNSDTGSLFKRDITNNPGRKNRNA